MLRPLAERFNVDIFDRVRKIHFDRQSELTDIDLTAFSKLEQVGKTRLSTIDNTKPYQAAIMNLGATPGEQAQVDVESELSVAFSSCQIKKIEHNQSTWTADVDPSSFCCE